MDKCDKVTDHCGNTMAVTDGMGISKSLYSKDNQKCFWCLVYVFVKRIDFSIERLLAHFDLSI